MEEQEESFIKGFNNGYLLAKHEPELATQLTAQVQSNETEYFKGLVSGKQQYDTEVRDWAKSFMRGGPQRDDRERGKEKEK